MMYRFHLVCPKCIKLFVTTADRRSPQPHVNCGECLAERAEVVELKVVKVEKLEAAK